MKKILISSLILAILQSMLFWHRQLGISVFIFVSLVIVLIIAALIGYKKVNNKSGLLLVVPIIMLSSTYFIFDNTFFKVLNLLVIPTLILVMIILVTDEKERIRSFFPKVFALLFGGIELFEDVGKSLKGNEENTNTKKIIKAILFAAPLVLIVIVLLSSADSVFGSIFGNITLNFFNENIVVNILRIFITAVLFFYFAGFVLNIVKEQTMYATIDERTEEKPLKINRFNINVTLTMLNFIYLIFCIIQFTFLFTNVATTENFNYAEYARQGFFQLMFVSALNIIMIFISTINEGNQGSDNSEEKNKKYTKFMNVIMCVFTIIIIFSAFYRMNLYEAAFGYTYLRLFVYFILTTELLLIIPTILYIVGVKIKLLRVYISIAVIMYLILNFINIDAVIARKKYKQVF
ncbi:MAG: DUF4173 domain-containing protein [Oscillospiraceae bacterium]|nr:DUF4173 domain-containing protein [Oscillospiraceae bacterium]